MDERIEAIAQKVKAKLGLNNYYLKRQQIFRDKNSLAEISYILTLEYFPIMTENVNDDDLNPDGSVVIDVDLHTETIKQVIFVNDISFADEESYPTAEVENIIDWVEQLTGLLYGKQFLLASQSEDKVVFHAAVDNIPVTPEGVIQVTFNDKGQLTLFAIYGVFPEEDQVEWEPFSLTFESVQDVIKNQCHYFKIPMEAEEKWLPIYAIEEFFITNDQAKILPFTILNADINTVYLNNVLTWEKTNQHQVSPFKGEEIDLSTEVSLIEALENKAQRDSLPITEEEQTACTKEATQFLQQYFPNDAGKWALRQLNRDNGYIIAHLKLAHGENRLPERKMKLILNSETLKVINYIDNEIIFDMFTSFQELEGKTAISKETALAYLSEYIEVTPEYVYDKATAKYQLCGKVDCKYGINAITGEKVLLHE